MSEISDAIQDKCLAFGDREIKLNDYLLGQAKVLVEVNTVDVYKHLLKDTKETINSGASYRVSMVTVGLMCDTIGV